MENIHVLHTLLVKKAWLLLILMLQPVISRAVNVEIDGIMYDVVTRGKVAKVIAKSPKYTGDVVIPASVTYEEVECAVRGIGDKAFYLCTGLTSVTIPSSVTSIGDESFKDCSGLTAVHITDIAAWCKIVFSGVESNPLYFAKHLFLEGQEVEDLVIPSSVTSIGASAFSGCSGITSVIIPSSVTNIESGTFSSCTSLTSVTIPSSVTSIEGGTFSSCTSLTSVTIPSSVTSIGRAAFYGCSGLTSVTIPSSLPSIGEGAFYPCI